MAIGGGHATVVGAHAIAELERADGPNDNSIDNSVDNSIDNSIDHSVDNSIDSSIDNSVDNSTRRSLAERSISNAATDTGNAATDISYAATDILIAHRGHHVRWRATVEEARDRTNRQAQP